jgi:solute carrier family 10 (sodium/bile acid cotransporter), member 7
MCSWPAVQKVGGLFCVRKYGVAQMRKYLPDNFTASIIAIVALGVALPCHGQAARWVETVSQIAIALLFFLQGVRLSRSAVIAGILHWRLHLIIFTATFVVFPLMGIGLSPLSGTVLAPPLYIGLLFLCCLPSAVQASVVFTSVAGGNVPAALCSASLSSILGIVLTPLLVGVLLSAHGNVPVNGIGSIALHLLLPFIVGQLLQGAIGPWMQRHSPIVRLVDRASVLLMVYAVISAATLSGVWSRVSGMSFLVLVLVEGGLLGAMLGLTAFAARRFGLSREDEIAIVFCGSKKSLVSGIPMANALFTDISVGLVVLPLMIFHQLQLMACATLAQRYSARMTAIAETDAHDTLHSEQFAER